MFHRRLRPLTAAVGLGLAATAAAGTPDFQLEQVGTYVGGAVSAAEIVAHDPASQRLFVTNAATNSIDVLDIADPTQPTLLFSIDTSAYGAGATSVATRNGLLAAAIPTNLPGVPGSIVLFDTDGELIRLFGAGVLPDHVSFSDDGRYLISANEGERVDDLDPRGSITLVDFAEGVTKAVATQIDFTAWDGREETLRSRGVRIFPDGVASRDLEPEYAAFAPDNSVAFVTLQEASAFAVVDLATKILVDIVPLGLKDHARGQPQVDTHAFPELPVLGTTPANQDIRLGGFSGLWYEGTDAVSGNLQFVTVPDRGPNGEPTNTDADPALERPFGLPDYQARVIRFELDPVSGEIELGSTLLLTRADGTTPISGLPNIAGADEEPVDLNGDALPYDTLGADLEGVVVADDGSYWMVDEYRPAIYHFGIDGALVERYVPAGTAALAGQPVGTFGMETLPAEYTARRANRGFEAMALDSDNNILYALIQTPLANPTTAASNASSVIRMAGIDMTSGQLVAEYVYLLEKPTLGDSVVDKMGDATYLGNGRFAAVERDSGTTAISKKLLFEFDLIGATNLLDPTAPDLLPGLTLEQHDADQLASIGVRPVNKIKVANLPSLGYVAGDKTEGLAVLPNGGYAILNDNDFGILPLPIPADGSIPLDPDPTPITLGLLSFGEGNGLDPSDDDGGIQIGNWPVYGMPMPDSIGAFTAGGELYFATANEGDDRGEIERIADLTLDTVAFPDPTLQDDGKLGRLNASIIDGDPDGDGEFERLQILGTRSFSIFDSIGNLVFDSGDTLEQITGAAFPDDFNSDNEANDSADSRSDNKGPEPEALAVGTLPDGRRIVFVGLERMGGVMAFDASVPTQTNVLEYVNPRDFSVVIDLDINPAAAGDLGPEGIVFIAAEDSPTGRPMIAVANEISGTISLYAIQVDGIFDNGFEEIGD